MIQTLIFLMLVAVTTSVCTADDLRSGLPKDCFLYSSGKGPNWTAKVSTEFRLSTLNRLMPCIDEQYSEPTEMALSWIERQKEPTVTTLASIDGRKVIQIVYPEQGSFGKTIGMILLAIETTRGSEWFAPFFGAQPELFDGKFVSGRDVAFGYIATLRWSGTGSIRTHYLFDLKQSHPVLLSRFDSGRVARSEFKSDQEFENALKVFDREAEFLEGRISDAKAVDPAKK